jgi:hypothetical protein
LVLSVVKGIVARVLGSPASWTPAAWEARRRLPFRGTEVLAAGAVTRGRLHGPAYRHLGRGIFIHATVTITPLIRAQAVSLWLPPGAAVTGRVAAQVWGVALDALDERVEIISSRRIRLTSDVLVHTGYIAHDEVTVHRGVTLTRPLHTAWELARAWPDVDAIGWIDALARRQRLTRSELRAHARRHASESRSRAATRTLHLADPRSESPPESRLRLEMLRAGLPLPIPQFRLVVDGFFVARLDFAWPALKFAVEYDGQWHVDARLTSRKRRNRLVSVTNSCGHGATVRT